MAPFDTTSRAVGVRTEPRLAPRSGNLTPPRFSPSCSHCLIPKEKTGAVAKQVYHCRRTRSSQNSLPVLLLVWMVPLITLVAVIYGAGCSTGGLRASDRIAFPYFRLARWSYSVAGYSLFEVQWVGQINYPLIPLREKWGGVSGFIFRFQWILTIFWFDFLIVSLFPFHSRFPLIVWSSYHIIL